MGHERRAWAVRAFGLACLVGVCAMGLSFNAFSQHGAKKKPTKTTADAGVSAPAAPPVQDNALSDLFSPDGGLATLLNVDAGLAVGRKVAPPPPPPSSAQVSALKELRVEADSYEKAAKDYRDAITRIVRQHYEERRKRMLQGLDRELGIEKKALAEARAEAIKRYEEFIARYIGPNAQPEATPDAMYRLAALYDERARDTQALDLVDGLMPAVALYRRVIREFPKYREIAGVHYYLAHALLDSNRLEEAQQVFRHIVCTNVYPYPVAADPKNPDRDRIEPVLQDREPAFWDNWRHLHPTPESIGEGGSRNKPAPKWLNKKPQEAAAADGELTYKNPFPDTCVPIPQKVEVGRDPRYIAEVWWRIGDWYFDEVSPKGGPYNLNRAVTGYRWAMKASSQEKQDIYRVAMYKLAWTYFKQQRYETAVRTFIELLHSTDEYEKRTGDPGADFRAEAYTYIATSLTYVDFAGPAENDPYIPRNDVLDLERDPRVAEQKMHIAIQRVADKNLIPQDKKWTVEIYKSLAQEYKEINQLHNQIEVSEQILKQWPCFRDAPSIQAGIADTYDDLTRQSREGTAEHAENSSKALDARSKLVAYVGNTPWTDCNRDDPEALQTAERLVRGGLYRAAADHTNLARAFYQKARETGDKQERSEALARALQEYRLAEQGWGSYLDEEPNAPDAYESRFWLAEARHGIVKVAVATGQSPSSQDVLRARQAAVAVRDSNEDDRFLEQSALFAVDLAFLVRDDQYRLFRESNGARGLEERTGLKFSGDGKDRKVVREPLPLAVRFLNLAQEEYVQRVPPNLDLRKNGPMFRFQVAESFFFYGQFDEARKRFEPIYAEQCGQSDFGYKAWEHLLTMSNLELNFDESRRLAEAQKEKSCAVSQEQKTAEALLINPTLQEAAYVDARKAYEQAEKMKDGPERQDLWRKAAALYRTALENAPDRDEAPEAAMNGANAYKQVGEYDKAIGMYNLFIGRYGDEKTLSKLQSGDPKAKPPAEPKPEQYKDRVKFLKLAYEQLSKAYVLFFNYRKAAEEYDKISQIQRFDEKERRDAAKNALVLYANMGDRTKTDAVRKRLLALGPSAEEKAESDYIVARGDMNEWDEHGRDEGANRDARVRAMTSMSRYYDQNAKNPAAAQYVVIAAYNAAKTRKVGNDPSYVDWYKKTMAAFDAYKTHVGVDKSGKSSALGSSQAAMAAEAEFTLLDAEIRKNFDYETGHHRYQGTTVDVTTKYRADVKEAEKYFGNPDNPAPMSLQHVIKAYMSPDWLVAALSRQGSLYDSLRTGLFNARPKLFSEKEEKILKKFRDSDNPDDQEKADQYETKRRDLWRDTRDKELGGADQVMVNRYTQAIALARKYNINNPAVDRAIQRLAFVTDIIGDDKLRSYSQTPPKFEDFTYVDGMFLRARPGIVVDSEPDPLPPPLPVVPQ